MDEYRAKQNEKKQMKHQLMEQRAESARQIREKINKKDMDDKYNNYIQNRERADRVLNQRKSQKFHETLQRKFQLEEKLQNVRHTYNAMNYNAQLERERKSAYDESLISYYQNQNNQINRMKQKEKWDYQYSRQKLNKEAQEVSLNPLNMYNDINGSKSVSSNSNLSINSPPETID